MDEPPITNPPPPPPLAPSSLFMVHSFTTRRVPKVVQLFKVYMCVSYMVSQCACPFSSRCRFAHGPNEQRSCLINIQFVRKLRTMGQERASVDPSKYKVRLCDKFMAGGMTACEYGENCMYAHGEPELRSVEANRKAEAQLKRLLLHLTI
eukprot:PhM_4_TR12260/c0_g1_i1/m.52960